MSLLETYTTEELFNEIDRRGEKNPFAVVIGSKGGHAGGIKLISF
jgi:hypothetical protein